MYNAYPQTPVMAGEMSGRYTLLNSMWISTGKCSKGLRKKERLGSILTTLGMISLQFSWSRDVRVCMWTCMYRVECSINRE